MRDLYKVKSGDGIVSELFHFSDRGERDLAIRPEFTPTLARMIAAQASALPKPIKWFCTPNCCRAERPQRGRLREFWQWNVDILGLDSALVDAECIFTCIDLLAELGFKSDQLRVKISHRHTTNAVLSRLGVTAEQMPAAFNLLDARSKMTSEHFAIEARKLGLDDATIAKLDHAVSTRFQAGNLAALQEHLGADADLSSLRALDAELVNFGIGAWCEYDLSIVRGLAYYTGMVFEVHEATGAERAMAGGGRYDKLIELFDGPPTPAVGFGMGDVVLANVLSDKGLMPANSSPRPDAYFLAATDAAALKMPTLVGELRRVGLHARFTYKTTRKIGKLFKDATDSRARFAVILDDKLESGIVSVKNLDTGEQSEIPLDQLQSKIRG